MAALEGRMVICDRCDESIFLKLLGERIIDGGYTRVPHYEDLPDDWMYETEIGYLCPKCAKVFKAFIKEFMGPRAVAPVWRLKEETNE